MSDRKGWDMKVLYKPAANSLAELDERAVRDADVVVIAGNRVVKDRDERAPRNATRRELADLRAAARRA